MKDSAGKPAEIDADGQSCIAAGDWMLELGSHRLVRGSDANALNPKELSVLRHLLDASPSLVTTEELLIRTWPDVVVGDHVLHEVISRLRKLLGDDARDPSYIETLPRRGYRWIATRPMESSATSSPAATSVRTVRSVLEQQHVLTGLLVLLSVLVAISFFLLLWPGSGGSKPLPLRVAVLPFEVLSDEPDGYLVDGLYAGVQNRLATLPGVVVLARSAVVQAMESAGGSLTAARHLDSTHAVEGTISAREDTYQITVYLLDPRTGEQLWRKEYSRALAAVSSIDSEIALDLSGAFGLTLTPADRKRIGLPSTTSVAALRLFERASPERLDASDPAENRAAIELLRAAAELDPGFAEALAWQSWREVWAFWNGDRESKDAAVRLAEAAMALAPQSGISNYAMGRIHVMDNRIRLGIQFFQRAVELAPSQPAILGDLSLFHGLIGNLEASLDMALRLVDVDPRSLDARWTTAVALRRLDEYERAEIWLRSSLEELPDYPWSQRVKLAIKWLGMAHGERLNESDYRSLAPELVGRPQARSVLASQLLLGKHWTLTEEWLRPVVGINPLLRSGMDDNPLARSVRAQLGFALIAQGQREEALALFYDCLADAIDYVEAGGERPSIPLEIAAIHAALGNSDASLSWLDRAYDAGIREHRFVRIDPMFRSLREDDRFQKRLDRMAEDVATKRENARALGLLDEVDRLIASAGKG